jgi:hypothetical protein
MDIDAGQVLRLLFAYTKIVMPARPCSVSFTDASGVTHSVEVTAESLMEAVALGLRDLRASGLTSVMPGTGTSITVRVNATAVAEHSVTFRQFLRWLDGNTRSPQERLLKERLREAVDREQ